MENFSPNAISISLGILVLVTIINLFLYAIAKKRRDSTLATYSSYFFLIYPLLLLLFLFSFLDLRYVLGIWILVAVGIVYYLFVFLPSYRREEFQVQTPIGITATQEDQWKTTDKNTTYYPEYQKASGSLQGKSGPCVVDDRFGYQLAFDKKNQCLSKAGLPAPVSPKPTVPSVSLQKPTPCLDKTVDFDQACQQHHGKDHGMKELSQQDCPSGQVRADCEKGYQGGYQGDGSSTQCLPIGLPPKLDGGDFNFWCQYRNNKRGYGYSQILKGKEGGCYQNNEPQPQVARAKCSESYRDGFYRWGDAQKVKATDCLPWDTNFDIVCTPNRLKKKITGGCPPTEGRGLCDLTIPRSTNAKLSPS